ncbi:MAG: phage major capsid protein, partial [Clostridia bacterium]|nr:phage major capsid protein [Clostridia bacterium]
MTIKKVLEMKAKREDARLKAMEILNKAEAEDRFLTEDEQKEIDKFESEIRAWDESIGRAEKILSIEPRNDETVKEEPEVKPTPEDEEKRNKFSSFGEQLIAVYRAVCPGGKVDPRLSARVASGANETNPSDGGFLVQQDFVKDLLKRTYDTGILASKVKKIPVTGSSNGIKIRAVDEESRANGSRWGGVQTFWEGEADQIGDSKPKFRIMELSLKKLTGLCYATDELLEDA